MEPSLGLVRVYSVNTRCLHERGLSVADQEVSAAMRGLEVSVDPEATGSCDIDHRLLGTQTADEVKRSALLHLTQLRARIASPIEVEA